MRGGVGVPEREAEPGGAVSTSTPVDDVHIGARVRAARRGRGRSLRALSSELALSAATMSQLETGKTVLSVVRLHRIAAALGMTADQVLATPLDGPEPPGTASDRLAGATGADWRGYGPLDFDPVLAAALAVFLRTGYHGATVRDIARECGRSVSGIYHHHPSKQHMLRTILDIGVSEMLGRAEAARAEGRDPVERFSLMIESLVLFHTHRREVGFLGASEMRSLAPAARREIAARRTAQQRMIDEEALAAAAAGRFRVLRPTDAARAVVTMCTSIPQWFKPDGALTPDRIAAQYVRHGLDLMRLDRPE